MEIIPQRSGLDAALIPSAAPPVDFVAGNDASSLAQRFFGGTETFDFELSGGPTQVHLIHPLHARIIRIGNLDNSIDATIQLSGDTRFWPQVGGPMITVWYENIDPTRIVKVNDSDGTFLQNLSDLKAHQFTLKTNATAAGVWNIKVDTPLPR